MQHTATLCITPQHAGPLNGPPKELLVPYPHLASRCNTLQHCNTLQNSATICITIKPTSGTKQAAKRATCSAFPSDITLQHIAPLQHAATLCNTPQNTGATNGTQKELLVPQPQVVAQL